MHSTLLKVHKRMNKELSLLTYFRKLNNTIPHLRFRNVLYPMVLDLLVRQTFFNQQIIV